MNYPDKIYKKFEIVEKDICGKTFYGVKRVVSVLGVKFKYHKKINQNSFMPHCGRFDSFNSRKWVDNKSCAKDAIEWENVMTEYNFKKKVTK